MMTPLYPRIKCARCYSEETQATFKRTGIDCQQKKCWLRKPKVLKIAAQVFECLPGDLIAPTTGKLILYKEAEPKHSSFACPLTEEEEREILQKYNFCD